MFADIVNSSASGAQTLGWIVSAQLLNEGSCCFANTPVWDFESVDSLQNKSVGLHWIRCLNIRCKSWETMDAYLERWSA